MALLTGLSAAPIISDLAAAEFASAVSRKVRMAELSVAQARLALLNFDGWRVRSADQEDITSADLAEATAFIRRLDLSLRTPDAIHVAVARRIGATLATLDRRMAADARSLGVPVPAI